MTYSLEFVESALKEWRKLAPSIRNQLKKKLAERLEHPRVPSARLQGMADCYKIKLRTPGHRLLYQVNDKTVVVTVIAVGKRDKLKVYRAASERIRWLPGRILQPACFKALGQIRRVSARHRGWMSSQAVSTDPR